MTKTTDSGRIKTKKDARNEIYEAKPLFLNESRNITGLLPVTILLAGLLSFKHIPTKEISLEGTVKQEYYAKPIVDEKGSYIQPELYSLRIQTEKGEYFVRVHQEFYNDFSLLNLNEAIEKGTKIKFTEKTLLEKATWVWNKDSIPDKKRRVREEFQTSKDNVKYGDLMAYQIEVIK